MGNRSSTPSSEEEGSSSGMYLTPELQGKINTDFEEKIIQTQWNSYRKGHIERYQQREVQNAQRQHELQQKQQQLNQQAKLVHDELDGMVDGAKSKLSDIEVALEYDMKRLSEKFQDSEVSGGAKCVDVRAELSRCYNTLDSGECQVFAKKLEKCVTEALA
mmetsp:Transcript_37359/g.55051  ORF Transcript_37359/g.55051 Transcript_37359/m.55051 type:complete len:161 (+) Transcript_37359:90-572(+)